MKKILVLLSLFTISSCSLFGAKPTSFQDYYTRSVNALFDTYQKNLDELGLYRSVQVAGTFNALVSVPMLMSGSFQTDIDVRSDNRDGEIIFKNGKLQYDGLSGTGGMKYDIIDFISKAGSIYISYQGLSDGIGLDPAIDTVIKKYENTWLSWTQEDALSGTTDPIEIRTSNMTQKLSEMSLKDIKKYLNDYPIWKPTSDLGMSGALHMWSVELDKDQLVALIQKVNSDLSGENMSDDETESLRSGLASLDFSGTIGFSPDDALATAIQLIASQSGVVLGSTSASYEKNLLSFSFQEGSTGALLHGSFSHDENSSSGKITLNQGSTEVGSLVASIDHPKKKFHELKVDMLAQGISVSLVHTMKDEQYFEGRLLLPVGSISWQGSVEGNKLSSLKAQGASPSGAFELDLTQSGSDMMQGPLVLRVDNEEIFRANVGLLSEDTLTKSQFRLSLDIPQGTGSTDMIHGELGWDLKKSAWKSSIKVPSPLTPLNTMIEELNAVAPSTMYDNTGDLSIMETGLPEEDTPYTNIPQ